MRKTTTIEQGDIKIVLSEASVLQGLRRTRLQNEERNSNGTDLPLEVMVLKLFTYPTVIGAIESAEGIEYPPTFEQFCDWAETLVTQLENAALELNPHWALRTDQEEEKKKDS